MTTATADETTFTARRLTVAVPGVREFQRNYEAAVPDAPADKIAELVQRRAPWAEMEALIEASAPYAAWFSVDQPSTQFGSLGNPQISDVGLELDRKLAALLQALDVDAPPHC